VLGLVWPARSFRDLDDEDRSAWIPIAVHALAEHPTAPAVVEACLYTLNLVFAAFPSADAEADAVSAIASGAYEALVAALLALPHASPQLLEILRFLCILGQSGASSACALLSLTCWIRGGRGVHECGAGSSLLRHRASPLPRRLGRRRNRASHVVLGIRSRQLLSGRWPLPAGPRPR
jgi:hypothetical protein